MMPNESRAARTTGESMSGQEYQAYNTYGELIAALKSLCLERNSGTLYIATPDNHFARVVLKGGDIVALSFRAKHGIEAVALIRGITGGRFKFSPGQVNVDADHVLPSGYDVMRVLAADAAFEEAAPRRAVAADKLVSAPRVIEQQLAEFLGPMSTIVCEEQLAKLGAPRNVGELSTLLEALAREIGDPAKARRFKDQVWAKLGA